jgi:hypothetical protein
LRIVARSPSGSSLVLTRASPPAATALRRSGLENIDASFARSFQKSALYLSEVQGFPPAFGVVCATPDHGRIVGAMFISGAEFAALQDLGSTEFEAALASQHVDPFSLRRPSATFDSPAPRSPA